MPSVKVPEVAAAIATARIFLAKVPTQAAPRAHRPGRAIRLRTTVSLPHTMKIRLVTAAAGQAQ